MTPSTIPLTKTKVGTGVLFFCFNNGLIDYTKLTRLATKLVHENLRLPVCVVTDQAHTDFGSEHVILVDKPEASTPRYFGDYAQTAAWYNVGRECSLDVTPFKHTVVLDSDYLVLSDVLLKYTSMPLALSRSAFFLGGRSDRDMSYMPLTNMPMYWATVIVFDSCSWPAEVFFSAMKRLKRNWSHLASMSGLDPSLYRNDYVATMALSMLQENRWSREFDLPVELVTAGFDCTVSQIDSDSRTLKLGKTTSTEVLRVKGVDVHVFNKKSLLESLDAAQP
jgi:hypothetical protein